VTLNESWRKSTTSHTNGCVEVRWRTATACPNANCVEVKITRGVSRRGVTFYVYVRDSKVADGPELTFTAHEWQAFLDGVGRGEFDLPGVEEVSA